MLGLGINIDWTPEIEAVSAVIVLSVVGVLHRRVERKMNKADRKIDGIGAMTTSIDRAVNSRPDTDPKLYDIASAAARIAEQTRNEARESLAAIGRKIDRGFDGVNTRFDAVDRRCSAIDNRVDAIDRRADANATAIDRLEATKTDRGSIRSWGLDPDLDPDPV